MRPIDPAAAADPSLVAAQAAIGGFLTRCSALDYHLGQLIARWFCKGEKQRYLSYVLHSMPFEAKAQVIKDRLTAYPPGAPALRVAVAEAEAITERRSLVAHGLLERRTGGGYSVKSYAGARFFSEASGRDIIDLDELADGSRRATHLRSSCSAWASASSTPDLPANGPTAGPPTT